MGHGPWGVRCFHLSIKGKVKELLNPTKSLRDFLVIESMAGDFCEAKAMKGLYKQLGGRETLRVQCRRVLRKEG
jgi:hypothetical protein